ncbi:MAG: flagellar biosynthesis protein FlhB [Alphaproteobacteria bacterium]|nr:flagellar biosynthesis protein FlhB [Alphaproteobacteria bacterium]
MAEEQDDSQKTEDPTSKRLQEAQERGDVPKSHDLVTWLVLATATGLMSLYFSDASRAFAGKLSLFLAQAHAYSIDMGSALALMREAGYALFVFLAFPLAAIVVAAMGGNLLQHPPVLSADRIAPKLDKLSPMQGAKRLFGRDALVNFARGLLKMAVVASAAFLVLWPLAPQLEAVIRLDLAALMPYVLGVMLQMMGAILAALFLIAVLDYAYQRWSHFEKLRMSKQEVRDEYKQNEGDPHVRAKIRQIRQERARKRMMAAVPQATAVVVNPTHYAVALSYESGKMRAPVCVAKGVDLVALRIRTIAEENNVPIVENPPLARTLYASVEIDEEIPQEHYKAVAQVIGYVMRLKGKVKSGRRRI